MRISKIKIKNYRSFNEQGIEIDLPDNNLPLAIVGHNNSGKSNFINAILQGQVELTEIEPLLVIKDKNLRCTEGFSL